MGFKCGIVGLPNVGKSTLFNALTKTIAAQAANYPFCTIEPNLGIIGVPDERLDTLAKLANSAKIIPTQLKIVDIAGLVKGASKGEGLGNKFLSHVREVDAIIHVVRCFEDNDVIHVSGKIDPLSDLELIETELMLADLDSISSRLSQLEKKARGRDKEVLKQIELLNIAHGYLNKGQRAYKALGDITLEELRSLQLITAKPVMYVCNVLEKEAKRGNQFSDKVQEKLGQDCPIVVISSKVEAELALLDDTERKGYLDILELEESGLEKVIKAGYGLLDLVTFFTVGEKEARAWTVTKGSLAPEAAGVIHTDFMKGFIRAETISYADYIYYKGEQQAKAAGKMRLEGKDYVVQDGDILHFRFNV